MTCLSCVQGASLGSQVVKNPPAVQETLVRFLGWEDPLEKEQATHSSWFKFTPLANRRAGTLMLEITCSALHTQGHLRDDDSIRALEVRLIQPSHSMQLGPGGGLDRSTQHVCYWGQPDQSPNILIFRPMGLPTLQYRVALQGDPTSPS